MPPLRLRLAPLLALVCGGIVLSCNAPVPVEDVPTLDQLRGEAVGEPPLAVLPDGDWRAGDDGLRFAADGKAKLFVRAQRGAPSTLVVVFHARPRLLSPSATWDGEALTTIRRRPDGSIALRIPGGAVHRGDHRLELTWAPRAAEPTRLQQIFWRSGEFSGSIARDDLWRLRLLERFLIRGVSAQGRTKLGGILVLGARDLRVRLDGEGDGVLRARPRNDSGHCVELAVRPARGGEALWHRQLAPGQETSFELRVPGRERELVLAIGSDGDVAATTQVLWGEPRFVTHEPATPLILLLTLDTTRRDALGIYGRAGGWTPFLDRFAAGATLYARASSTTSWTLPAHASMFTGLLPREHSAGVNAPALPAGIPTLASLLSSRYRTVGFAGGPYVCPIFGMARGFGSFGVPKGWETPGRELADRVLAALEESRDEPLFLFANFFDPHFPYRQHPDLPQSSAVSAAAAGLPATSPARELLAGDVATLRRAGAGTVRLSPAGKAALAAAYLGEVAEMDRQIGRVFEALRRAGRYDDALIVVAGDHGELLGENDHYHHGTLLEPELTSIPLIVKYPRQQAARRVETPVSLIDIFPTVLRAARLAVPPERGLDLTDLDALKRRGAVFFEEHQGVVHPLDAAILLGPHLIGAEDADFRVLRWASGEKCWRRNGDAWQLVACPAPPGPALERRLAAIALVPPPPPAGTALSERLNDAETAGLRALGYL